MTKKTEDFKKMKTDELEKNLDQKREAIRVIRFKAEGAKSKNVKEAKNIRKDIARILTQVSKNNKK